MMSLKAFFILSVLLCGLIIQPSMAARDLAHDTQTKVVAQKPVDAAALEDTRTYISYSRSVSPPSGNLHVSSSPCSSYRGGCSPPSP